jgi:hypothetical protein
MAEQRKRGRPMGVRHQDDVRAKIQAGQLVKILTDHAIGLTEEISASRMKAIEILLRKSLPDLQAIELKADVTGTFAILATSKDQDL